jgi:hypothetical protein
MPKDIKNIEQEIMSKIREGKIKMRPRMYFTIGSAMTFIGLIASIATSVFTIGVISFLFRSNGRIFGRGKMEYLLSILPWWLPVVAVAGLTIGVYFIRKYDFSYKIDFKKGILVIILAVIFSGWLVDALGFNDLLVRKGLMRRAASPFHFPQTGLNSR